MSDEEENIQLSNCLSIPPEDVNSMNTIVWNLYPKECIHTNEDARQDMCCTLYTNPNNFTVIRHSMVIVNQIIPLAIPMLCLDLSHPEVLYIALHIRVLRLAHNADLVPVVVARYFTWHRFCLLRILELKSLYLHSEDAVFTAITDGIDQVGIRSKIISIQFEPDSVPFPGLQERIRNHLGGAGRQLFQMEFDLTKHLIDLHTDLAAILPFNLKALVKFLLTNEELKAKLAQYSKEMFNIHLYSANFVPAIIPDPNSLLHQHLLLFQLGIYGDLIKKHLEDASKGAISKKFGLILNFLRNPANRLLLVYFSKLTTFIMTSLTCTQRTGVTFAEAANSLLFLSKACNTLAQSVFTDQNRVRKEESELNQEQKTYLFNSTKRFFDAAIEKCTNLAQSYIGPFRWILLEEMPDDDYTDLIFNSLDFFVSNGFPLGDLNFYAVENEVKLIRSVLKEKLFTVWHANEWRPTYASERWDIVFDLVDKLKSGQELVVLPRLIAFIFTALPVGLNEKIARIYEDIQHFWDLEFKRGKKGNYEWLQVRTALMMRHNIGHDLIKVGLGVSAETLREKVREERSGQSFRITGGEVIMENYDQQDDDMDTEPGQTDSNSKSKPKNKKNKNKTKKKGRR